MSVIIDHELLAQKKDNTENTQIAIPVNCSYFSEIGLETIRLKHGLKNVDDVIRFLGFQQREINEDFPGFSNN